MSTSIELPSPRFAPSVELPIPAVAHFIWLGASVPWTHLLALASAAKNGGFARIVLHADTPAAFAPHIGALTQDTPFELRPLVPRDVFAAIGRMGDALAALYERLDKPAAKANVLRVALLYAEGGVYFDMDTITLRPLTPLRGDAVFCGLERVCLPVDIARSRAPHVLALTGARMALREACRRVPDGWRPFRALEGIYPLAANNAILGAAPGHPFLRHLIEQMIAMPRERQHVRYALGTHLLQEALRSPRADEVATHPPEVFYALAPEISEHWFKPVPTVDLEHLVSRRARVVHWYASVRTEGRLDHLSADVVCRERHHLPFAALACRAMNW